MSEKLVFVAKSIPEKPGVYQFYNKEDKIIYVGKAKNLKKRVLSYFQSKKHSKKTLHLINSIHNLRHIVVPTESDALILENTLIKEHQPRYNILLRDDKTYPWICIKNEKFPRVFLTRKLIKDGSEYYGPYTNVKGINALLNLIKTLYPIRTSNYNLSQKQINRKDIELCLNIHRTNENTLILGFKELTNSLKNILTKEEYNNNIIQVRQILNGKFLNIKESLKKQMLLHSSKLEFEKAQTLREKLTMIENYQSKSVVVSPKINDVDVFSIVSDDKNAFINFLQISFGSIVRFHNTIVKKKLDETDQEILRVLIVELRRRFASKSKEIFLQFDLKFEDNIVTVPKIGEKKHLLELSIRNSKILKIEHYKQLKFIDPEQHQNRIMLQMKKDLRLKHEPNHIECFDNSNIQGSNPTSACVVFKHGKPSKKDYRHYIIKGVSGPDDYASMEEAVFRRYRRVIDEKLELPKLLIIDGGKGQLSAAIKSLNKLDIKGKIPVLGIAKKLEKLFFPDDPVPLYLDKRSETLKIIQQIRNESHRFSLRLHRKKRSKGAVASSLDNIHGIGEKTKTQLLKKFKSVKRIKEAEEIELVHSIGKSKGAMVYKHFN